MVETDVGNDRDEWGNDVGAVQTSAKAYFYDGNVYLHITEVLKGQGCGDFKERRVQRLKERALFIYKVYHDMMFFRFAQDRLDL